MSAGLSLESSHIAGFGMSYLGRAIARSLLTYLPKRRRAKFRRISNVVHKDGLMRNTGSNTDRRNESATAFHIAEEKFFLS